MVCVRSGEEAARNRKEACRLSVKIKVSYEYPEELQLVLDRLRPEVKAWKVSGNREGRFCKAYIELSSKSDEARE